MTPVRLVVMGVSGCGKSTIGLALANRLGLRFLEGDSLHPASNIQAMTAGHALTDAMRLPWLQAVADGLHRDHTGSVASCSALRRSYRDVLRQQGPVFFVHLTLGLQETRDRLLERSGHFMNPALAESQHASLEPLQADEWGMTVAPGPTPEGMIDQICDDPRFRSVLDRTAKEL